MYDKEELVNAITHAIGAVMALAGLVMLIIMAASEGTAWHVVGFTIFGSTMVLLYLASTLYHSVSASHLKSVFRKLDHMAIYLLIAGTYTPFCLVVLHGYFRWLIFGIVWGLAIFGIIFKLFYTGKKELLSTILYLAIGWMGVLVMKSLYHLMSLQGFIWLLLGGVLYTIGTYFYTHHKIKYNHGIWHLFVLAGSSFHYFAVVSVL